MSYLRYANLCADYLRSVMKEPFKTKAELRQIISFRSAPYVDGKAGPTSESCFLGAFLGSRNGVIDHCVPHISSSSWPSEAVTATDVRFCCLSHLLFSND